MKNRLVHNPIKNSSGFIVADFLFAFVMVLGIGVFIFGLTFALAVVEVSQYIIWSTARNYAAGNQSQIAANTQAKLKFENLTAQFPIITGNGSSGDPWFEFSSSDLLIGDLSIIDSDFANSTNADDRKNNFRQPWHGASSKVNLKLFAGLQIPFLGKVAKNPNDFKFPVRAFLLRHPSRTECIDFFMDSDNRYKQGIKELENGILAPLSPPTTDNVIADHVEDNGC